MSTETIKDLVRANSSCVDEAIGAWRLNYEAKRLDEARRQMFEWHLCECVQCMALFNLDGGYIFERKITGPKLESSVGALVRWLPARMQTITAIVILAVVVMLTMLPSSPSAPVYPTIQTGQIARFGEVGTSAIVVGLVAAPSKDNLTAMVVGNRETREKPAASIYLDSSPSDRGKATDPKVGDRKAGSAPPNKNAGTKPAKVATPSPVQPPLDNSNPENEEVISGLAKPNPQRDSKEVTPRDHGNCS